PLQIQQVFAVLCQLKQLSDEQAKAKLAEQLYDSCSEVFRI
ncbi:MAG: TatD family hydrolase, partial [Pseudoalteromonas sp.]